MGCGITVVLATYNGQEFILEQLESIVLQTRQVNQVVITDDGSTDNTLNICWEYAKKYDSIEWTIVKNNGKHGFYENFCNGLRLATGDYIILCDQDDVWLDTRVETMLNLFRNNDDMLGLASTFSRFNKNGELSSHQHHPHARENDLKKINLREYCHFHDYLGMSMMLKKSVIDEFNKFADSVSMPHKSHDIILSFFAVVNGGFYYVDKVLTKRRSYEDSTSNRMIDGKFRESNYKKKNAYRFELKAQYMQAFQMLSQQDGRYSIAEEFGRFEKCFRQRACYIDNSNIMSWLAGLIDIKHYDDFSDWVKDLFRMFKK